MVTVKKKATFSSFQTSIQIPELHKDKTNKKMRMRKHFICVCLLSVLPLLKLFGERENDTIKVLFPQHCNLKVKNNNKVLLYSNSVYLHLLNSTYASTVKSK